MTGLAGRVLAEEYEDVPGAGDDSVAGVLDRARPGDEDLTDSEEPDPCRVPDPSGRWECAREVHRTGQHVAGQDGVVVAVWMWPRRIAGGGVTARTTQGAVRMTDDLYAGVDRVVYWLDSRNGRGDHELTARILKIAEEFGEATQAWIGHLGQNPRKGRTNTRTVVADELADVVVTALVAMRSLGFHPSVILADKARALAERITADDSPIWAGCERHPDRLSGRDCPDCATQTALITAGDYEPLVCVACDKPITGRVIGSSPDDDIYHPECHTRDEFPGGDR